MSLDLKAVAGFDDEEEAGNGLGSEGRLGKLNI